MRLQKFLSEQGVCSRRQAEVWIEEGRITVNGQVAALGQKVDPQGDTVMVGRRRVQVKDRTPQTYILHKPRHIVCTHADPHHERNVFDLLPAHLQRERLLIAGRLDKDSEGLLLLTTDGDLVQRITHPTSGVIKRYRVKVHRPFDEALIPKLLEGREVEGDFLRFEKVVPAKMGPDAKQRLEIHLEHGRKREIRRLLETHGYFVKRLQRFQIGGLVLKGLGPGMFRKLSEREIKRLFETPRPR